MIWHPFSLAVITADLITLLFLARAAGTAVRTLADWSEGAGAREQIRLETACETASLSARCAFLLMLLSTFLLVVAVSNVFPGLVPGAMCGTGVLQATGGLGGRAFLLRLPAIGLLYILSALDRLNRSRPDFPLARQNARFLLLAAPLVFLSVFDTFSALKNLNVHIPVDCCTAVYGRIAATGGMAPIISDPVLLGLFAGATVLLIVSGAFGLSSSRKHLGLFCAAAAVFAMVWGLLSAITLVKILARYIYEVLNHHCPWCLFLPEHRFIGFALFSFLGLAVFNAAAAFFVFRLSAHHPGLSASGDYLSRRLLALMILFALLFTATAIWPALFWRLRFGVWMG